MFRCPLDFANLTGIPGKLRSELQWWKHIHLLFSQRTSSLIIFIIRREAFGVNLAHLKSLHTHTPKQRYTTKTGKIPRPGCGITCSVTKICSLLNSLIFSSPLFIKWSQPQPAHWLHEQLWILLISNSLMGIRNNVCCFTIVFGTLVSS